MKKRCMTIVLLLMLSLLPICGMKMNVEAKVIYTTNAKVNAAAAKIIRSCTSEGMTPEQKLRQVYLYLVKHMKYSYRTGRTRVKVSSKEVREFKLKAQQLSDGGQDIRFSNQFKKRFKNVLTLQGTCYGQSMIFCILANQLGFDAKLCHGKYVTNGGKRSNHYWCYIVMDGQKKYFDIQIANFYWKRRHSLGIVDSFYMKNKTDHVWSKHHRG